jgi:hypothetical protein
MAGTGGHHVRLSRAAGWLDGIWAAQAQPDATHVLSVSCGPPFLLRDLVQ